MTKKRATITDVAKMAGVSIMTVSRVLNNTTNVTSTTRDKVMDAIDKLNYRPNVSARRLASTQSFFLGLLYNNPSAGYVSKFLLGALKSCRAKGYHLVVDECEGEIENMLETLESLIDDTKVDGIILLPPISDIPEILETLQNRKVPFVRIAPDKSLDLSPYVCMDDYSAAFDMTNYLIKQGRQKIGFISGHYNQGVSRLRYQGYLDALTSNGLNVPPEYIEQGFFDYKSGMTAAEKILSLPDRPDAIFASNDDMAAAVIASAHKHGLEVPVDLAVAGFDDTHIATVVWPSLTTIRQPIAEMADSAIDVLSRLAANSTAEVDKQDFRNVLEFELIEREST